MTELRQEFDHDEIDLLLPWYVNHTLDAAEHERVARHMASCDKCQASVLLLSSVRSAVARNKATPIVPKPRVDEFLDLIDAKSPLRQRDWRRLGITSPASIAALLSIFVLFFAVKQDVAESPQQFETATSDQQAATMDYVLDIQFESETSLIDRERVLRDIEAHDILGDSEKGTYRVIVQFPATTLVMGLCKTGSNGEKFLQRPVSALGS